MCPERLPVSPRVTRLLRLDDVQQLVGLSRSSIYAQIRQGTFPTPVSIGARAVAWPSHEVEDWIELRIQSRRNSGLGVGHEA